MMNTRTFVRGGAFALLVGSCAGDPMTVTTEESQGGSFSLAPIGRQPIGAVLEAPAKSDQAPAPRIDQAFLQLTDERTGTLSLRLDEAQRALFKGELTSFSLSFADDKEAQRGDAVQFNDQGLKPDLRAGDGLFSGSIPVDLRRLDAINKEIAQLPDRRLVRFAPGGRQVIGRDLIPERPFDIEALLAGKVIRLPHLAELGPIRALGGAAVDVGSINPQKSLLITSLPVIQDPGRTMNPCQSAASNSPLKTWTFGHLMTEMAQGSGMSPSDFVESWLEHWRTDQTVLATGGPTVLDGVSGVAMAAVDNMIINPWRQRSGGGALDLRIAPFRLQAIIYRPDLAKSSPYGGGGNNGGELRFVFGLMEVRDANNDGDATDPGDTCASREMSVIFEYGVPLSTCSAIKNWANQWVALSPLLPGTPAFGAALEALTQAVVVHGAAPAKPNQNALNQLRTNEIDLTGIWQFREFVIAAGSGPLGQTTVKNNPREHQAAFTSVAGVTPAPIDLNGTLSFRNELVTNLPSILAGTYKVPEISAGAPFLGGASSYNFGTFWDHPLLATPNELEARFRVSLNTCSGCHTGETSTAFYHVRPTGPGSPPMLSSFLTVNPLNVVDNRGIPHSFSEMDNRKQALANLANQVCGFIGLPPLQILRIPLNVVH